jgi:ABC-type transporter Mla subunit MlaD
METIIEKDSPVAPLLLLAVVILFLLGGGLALAYLGGVFTGKNDVTANDKRIMDQNALLVPAR